MKKRSLRILSLIVAIVMAISILPLAALADTIDKGKGRVGLVVYGAELTQIVSQKNSLDSILDLAGDAIAEGVTVPKVKVELTNVETNQKYYLEEDKDTSLLETIEFQSEVYEYVVEKIKSTFEKAKEKIGNIPLIGATLLELMGNADKYTNAAQDKMTGKVTDYAAKFENVAKLNGTAYRVFKSEAIPEGKYKVYVQEFDTDEDAIRDGYMLVNDKDSSFYWDRTFTVDVQPLTEEELENGKTQYIGNKENGLGLTFNMNEIAGTFTDLLTQLKDKAIKLGATEENLKTINEALAITELDPSFKFVFPGLWTMESNAGFEFTNVDVVDTGLSGAEFLMFNRDEIVDILQFMIDLGKDALPLLMEAAFGTNEGMVGYDNLVKLHMQLVNTDENGELALNSDALYGIIKTYIGVLSDLDVYNRVVETNDLGLPTKLKYPIPAILKAEADENGLVNFNRESNITLTWMLEIVPQILAIAQNAVDEDNQFLNLMLTFMKKATEIQDKYGSYLINKFLYPWAQRAGFVGAKMQSGHYVMFQKSVGDPEHFWKNPFAYTMKVEWKNVEWVYVTLAELGILAPYFAEGFYEFVANTTFAGTVDRFLNKLVGIDDFNLLTRTLTDESFDLTEKVNQTMLAAVTAFMGQVSYKPFGLDTIFASKTDFISGINKYLYENGRTTQNLMIYVNKQAMRAKAVYTGYVTEDWYFYNLDKSPTTTATKLISKSTADLVNATAVELRKPVIQKAGDTVNKIVSTIGYKIEETAQNIRIQIKNSIGEAIKSVAQKAFDTVKNSVVDFFKGLFNRGMITYNA